MVHSDGTSVLVVDDDPYILLLLQEILKERGYVVFAAGNGQEALGILMIANKIKCIITDIMMPVKEGVSLIRSVRNNCKNIKIIAFTSMVEHEKVLQTALDFGADIAIKKPLDMTEMVDIVDRLMSNQVKAN